LPCAQSADATRMRCWCCVPRRSAYALLMLRYLTRLCCYLIRAFHITLKSLASWHCESPKRWFRNGFAVRAERRRNAYALLMLRAETQRVCVVDAACRGPGHRTSCLNCIVPTRRCVRTQTFFAPKRKRCLFYFPALDHRSLRENKRETLLPCTLPRASSRCERRAQRLTRGCKNRSGDVPVFLNQCSIRADAARMRCWCCVPSAREYEKMLKFHCT